MELKEKIHKFISTAKPVKQASVIHITNHFKAEGFSPKEVRNALDNLLREGETYELPETICLIE
ncbi:MAG: hypothetical protein Q7S55_00465 [Nanoarchaeota archaeon]|nr:hypothetical protein [Nanoarchaeota archaeon]